MTSTKLKRMARFIEKFQDAANEEGILLVTENGNIKPIVFSEEDNVFVDIQFDHGILVQTAEFLGDVS